MSARSLIRETSPAARKARRVRSASLGAGVGAFGRAAAAGLFLWATSSAAPLAAQSTIPGSQGGTFLIRGGTVVVAPGRVQEGASVLIRDGRIAAVGRDVGDAAGATVIDASGKYVYPGMIDSGSTLGLYEIGSVAGTLDISEMGRFNPHLRALTAVNPHSELIPVTRVNGVTTAIVQPSGGVISGQAALVRLDGWTPKEMGLRAPAALVIRYPRAGGFGFGGGGGPGGGQGQQQVERSVQELRDFLEEARQYHRVRSAGAGRLDPVLEPLRPIFEGEVPVLFEADTPDQIRGAIEIADAFGLRMILGGAREAWKLADTLAARGIPVILGPLTTLPGSDSPYDELYAQPGVLHRAGVKIAFASGSAVNSRNLPYEAALAVAYGLPAEAAWRALTVNPAEIWGVADEVGTIEVGKSADLFVATGDPLDVRTQVVEVFIAGRRVPMTDRHTELYRKFSERPRPQ